MCLTVYRDVPQWHRGDHFSSGMAGFRSPQEGGGTAAGAAVLA
jgi:hypothetical protein